MKDLISFLIAAPITYALIAFITWDIAWVVNSPPVGRVFSFLIWLIITMVVYHRMYNRVDVIAFILAVSVLVPIIAGFLFYNIASVG